MASIGLRYEDRLDGASNFSPWKERITILLKEQALWDIVGATATVVVPTYIVLKDEFERRDIKS